MTTLYKYTTGGRDVTFLDEADAYKASDIKSHWAGTFPELGSCQEEIKAAKEGEKLTETVEGQPVEVDKVVTFIKKVGTKGADDPNQTPRPLVFLSPEEAAKVRRYIADVAAWEAANEEALAAVASRRLADAAPRMLVALWEQRDLLRMILEVAVFYNGGREVVVKRLERLEKMLAEVSGSNDERGMMNDEREVSGEG